MPEDEHILPGAFGETSKTVPLVLYDADGTRHVVGKAKLISSENGFRMEAQVTDPELQKFVRETIGDFGVSTGAPGEATLIHNPKTE